MFLIDRTISDDSKEHDSKYSTSFEEQDSADHLHQLPHVPEKLPSTRLANINAVSRAFIISIFWSPMYWDIEVPDKKTNP